MASHDVDYDDRMDVDDHDDDFMELDPNEDEPTSNVKRKMDAAVEGRGVRAKKAKNKDNTSPPVAQTAGYTSRSAATTPPSQDELTSGIEQKRSSSPAVNQVQPARRRGSAAAAALVAPVPSVQHDSIPARVNNRRPQPQPASTSGRRSSTSPRTAPVEPKQPTSEDQRQVKLPALATILMLIAWAGVFAVIVDRQEVWKHTLPMTQAVGASKLWLSQAHLNGKEYVMKAVPDAFGSASSEMDETRLQLEKDMADLRRTTLDPYHARLTQMFQEHVIEYLILLWLSPLLLLMTAISTDLGLHALLRMCYLQHLHHCPTPLSHQLAVGGYVLIKGIELSQFLWDIDMSMRLPLGALMLLLWGSLGPYWALVVAMLYMFCIKNKKVFLAKGKRSAKSTATRPVFQLETVMTLVAWAGSIALILHGKEVWRHTLSQEQMKLGWKLLLKGLKLKLQSPMDDVFTGLVDVVEMGNSFWKQPGNFFKKAQSVGVLVAHNYEVDMFYQSTLNPYQQGLTAIFDEHVREYLILVWLSPLLLTFSTDWGFSALIRMYYLQTLHTCPTPQAHKLAIWGYLGVKGLELIEFLWVTKLNVKLGLIGFMVLAAQLDLCWALLGGIGYMFCFKRRMQIKGILLWIGSIIKDVLLWIGQHVLMWVCIIAAAVILEHYRR